MSVSCLLLILLTALILIVIGRRMELQDKNKLRLRKLEDQLFYNPVIRATQLGGIKINMSALLIFKLLTDNALQMFLAVLIFVIFNLLPLYYARILYKNGAVLEKEEKKRNFGTLYDNKKIDKERNHRVWAVPLAFFYRRTVFAIITVYLFEQPSLQMMVL